MDMFEIMSTVRDLTRLKSEMSLSTVLLKRYVNLGQDTVCGLLLPLYKEWIVRTLSGTGTGAISLPGDVMLVMDATRAGTPCEKVSIEDKNEVGWSVNFPGTTEFPAFLHDGHSVIFYPALSSTAYVIRYRKRLPFLVEGSAGSESTTSITLPVGASIDDDFYNDTMINLYTVAAGMRTFYKTLKITDYAGSSRIATLDGSITHGPTTYYCATKSIIPREYAKFIAEGALWYLARMGIYKGESAAEILATLKDAIKGELGLTATAKTQMEIDQE